MNKFILVLILFSISHVLMSQDTKLANEYFRSGEYEKASELYKKIYKKQAHNPYYFNAYINSLLALEEYNKCEKIIKKQIKKTPQYVDLYVHYGNVLERQNKFDEAEKKYKEGIKNMPAQRGSIINLGNSFIKYNKYDLAIRTYELGEILLKEPNIFARSLGDLYFKKGDKDKMVSYYLVSIKDNPKTIPSMKSFFDRNLDEEGFENLKLKLFDLVQEDPDNIELATLLTWVYVRQKKYDKALRQAKALDRRLDEKGDRVYKIASIAYNDRDFDTSIAAYQYLVDFKGVNSNYYINSRKEIINCKKKKMFSNINYTEEDIRSIEQEYVNFLDDAGRSPDMGLIILELAKFQAYYSDNAKEAIINLEELVKMKGLNKYVLANAKLNLADIYLIEGNVWEATLLYSQVDKDFKEGYLGEIARFKNARLSYFNGDFEWAQSQFDILKSATTKKISNDAIEMSVFITDASGLDTILEPLQLFAKAELLITQNKYDLAINKLDEITETYPEHPLQDDIHYIKAQIYLKQRNYDGAIKNYDEIIEKFNEEIRCDNAIFELADLYENTLDNPEKASELYEKLFIDYSNSTYAIEARKRYRKLRGDYEEVQ